MAKQAQVSLVEQQLWIEEAKIIVRDIKMMEVRTSGKHLESMVAGRDFKNTIVL